MLSFVVTFREVESGEMLPIKIKAFGTLDAERNAALELASRQERREVTGAWRTFSVSRCEP